MVCLMYSRLSFADYVVASHAISALVARQGGPPQYLFAGVLFSIHVAKEKAFSCLLYLLDLLELPSCSPLWCLVCNM